MESTNKCGSLSGWKEGRIRLLPFFLCLCCSPKSIGERMGLAFSTTFGVVYRNGDFIGLPFNRYFSKPARSISPLTSRLGLPSSVTSFWLEEAHLVFRPCSPFAFFRVQTKSWVPRYELYLGIQPIISKHLSIYPDQPFLPSRRGSILVVLALFSAVPGRSPPTGARITVVVLKPPRSVEQGKKW